MTELPPLDPKDWPAEIEHLKDGFAASLNVYRTMAHHPELLKAWAPLRSHVVLESALGEERLEIVILRIATRLGSRYEWTHHVHRATMLGLDASRIQSIGGPPENMSAEDRVIAESVDALIDDTKLTNDHLVRLSGLVGTQGVLDLMTTVGFYKVLGCIAETYDVQPDEQSKG